MRAEPPESRQAARGCVLGRARIPSIRTLPASVPRIHLSRPGDEPHSGTSSESPAVEPFALVDEAGELELDEGRGDLRARAAAQADEPVEIAGAVGQEPKHARSRSGNRRRRELGLFET